MAEPVPDPSDTAGPEAATDPESPAEPNEHTEPSEPALGQVAVDAAEDLAREAVEVSEDLAHDFVHTVVETIETRVEGHVEEAVEKVDEVAEEAVEGVEAFDRAVDRAFDRLRGNAPVDRLMYTASALADFSLVWHMLGVARAVADHERVPQAVRLSATLAVESGLVNGAIKSLFKRERPVPEFERPHHLRMPVTSSFPSGHASAAFCAATMLADGDRRAAPAYYAMAALVASSRVHVKIHHASDVLIGAGIGIALGRIARRVIRLG